MPLPASDSEMGTLRHKNDKPAKAKRAKRKAASRPGKGMASSAAKKAGATAPEVQTKGKPRRAEQTQAVTPASTPEIVAAKKTIPPKFGAESGPGITPPPLSTGPAAAASRSVTEKGPTGPALLNSASSVAGDRRRWSDRTGPSSNHGDGKKSNNESSDSAESPPRANKLVPTNAVHATERRIKRRMHKNGALMAAAGAALLGVLILSNQSEPPELVLNDRQIASRLPADQDWQSDATPEAKREAGLSARPTPQVAAPAPAKQQQTGAPYPQFAARSQPAADSNGLNTGDIIEMERILSRLELAVDAPDGIIDDDTAQAIRLYQEIAGLPVDGKASQDLLADMREVVKILDATN